MMSTSSLKQQSCAAQPAPSCSYHATISSFVNGYELSTVIDSGSLLSFINDKTVKAFKLHIEPCKTNVALVSSNLKGEILGRCVVDIVTENETYQQVSVGIIKNLCTNLLLGGYFQSHNKRVVFQYNGSKADLFVPKINHLNVMSELGIKPASLFNNLLSDCRPVVTKSRRFNAADQKFVAAKVNRLHSAGIIRPSVSSWRAQVLLVHNKESGKKRLCVDYSQTVNLFTQLDAYPLPRIDDLVNKLSAYRVLSTFDLKSAYHRIPNLESDKQYTVF